VEAPEPVPAPPPAGKHQPPYSAAPLGRLRGVSPASRGLAHLGLPLSLSAALALGPCFFGLAAGVSPASSGRGFLRFGAGASLRSGSNAAGFGRCLAGRSLPGASAGANRTWRSPVPFLSTL